MKSSRVCTAPASESLCSVAAVLLAVAVTAASAPALARFFEAASPDDRVAKPALQEIAASWKDRYAAMVVDMARQMRPARGLSATIA